MLGLEFAVGLPLHCNGAGLQGSPLEGVPVLPSVVVPSRVRQFRPVSGGTARHAVDRLAIWGRSHSLRKRGIRPWTLKLD